MIILDVHAIEKKYKNMIAFVIQSARYFVLESNVFQKKTDIYQDLHFCPYLK